MSWFDKAKGAANAYADKICAERVKEAIELVIRNPSEAAKRYGISTNISTNFLPFRIKSRSRKQKKSHKRKGSKKQKKSHKRKGSRKSKIHSRKSYRKKRSTRRR
jgi:hypothetical protein